MYFDGVNTHLRFFDLLRLSDKREASDLEIWLNEERYSWNASPFIDKYDLEGTMD